MSHWPTRSLGELAEVFNGKTPAKAEQRTSGHPVLKIRDVDESGNFRGHFESFVDSAFAESHENKKVRTGDVLILNAAHNADYVASKLFFADKQVSGAVATGEWAIIRARPSLVLPGFVHHWVRSQFGRTSIKNLVRGIHLYPSDLAQVRIALPSLMEQQRIIKLLDQADDLIKLRVQADHRTAALTPAVFREMFGDAEKNSLHWPTRRVEEVCDLVRGSSPRPRSDPRYYGGPIPRLMIEDITRDGWLVTPRIDSLTELGATMSRPVKAGTIVMAVSGNIGLCAQVVVDACIHDGFVAFKNLREDLFLPLFFGLAISEMREGHRRNQAGAIFQNITTSDVKNMSVPVPPLLLQNEFVTRVAEIRTLETAQASNRHQLSDLFMSTIHHAFNGDL